MRLLLDARLLHGGGIGRYIRELASRWLISPEVSLIRFLGGPQELEQWLAAADARGIAEVAPWKDAPYSPRAQLRWPARLARHAHDVDLTFFPHYDVPILRHPAPSLVTVHDLTHFRVPHSFPLLKRLPGSWLMSAAVRRATRVVTVSNASLADLVAFEPSVSGRARVVANGVGGEFRPLSATERSSALERWDAHRPFLLVVGACRPHKNVGLAIEVLGQMAREGSELRLVLAGELAECSEALREQARELGVEGQLDSVGPVSDAELVQLYGLAEAVLIPSRYEGFGLPALEAMACGAPVLAADRGGLSEVVGDGGILLDPELPAPWAEALRELTGGPSRRAELSARGRARAGHFSWEKCARETLAIAREAASI